METILPQDRYLSVAAQTVKYVKSKMDIGTSNKFLPNLGGPAGVLCVAESRQMMVKDLKEQAPSVKRTGQDPMKATLESWAYWATEYGCGNCGEQSAIAFIQLRDIWKTFPLDWMHWDGLAHAFVILGRIGITNPADVATWNDESVVCDPYYGEAMPASSYSRLRGKRIELLYRLESA